MTFEVLEPTWEDLIAKISVGKVSNVDQVLQIHSDFLSTCLNDCLLSNTTLLATVKKLLGVCSEFSVYMTELNVIEVTMIKFTYVCAYLPKLCSQQGANGQGPIFLALCDYVVPLNFLVPSATPFI